MKKRVSIRLKNVNGHATFLGKPSQELIDAVNNLAEVAYNEIMLNNHEIWHQCTACGQHYDLRMDDKCPNCGAKPQ